MEIGIPAPFTPDYILDNGLAEVLALEDGLDVHLPCSGEVFPAL
jgi:hypothetical protein